VGAAILARQKGHNVTEDVKSGIRPIVLGGGLAAVIALAIFAFLPEPQSTQEPQAESADASVAATPEELPASTDLENAEPASTVAGDALAAPLPPAGPKFDTFRVDPDGAMVIAGRAEAGQIVDVILANEALERVIADANGNFVALPIAGPSDQPRRLFLLADPEGAATPSQTSYIVAPIAAPVAAVSVPDPADENAAVNLGENVTAPVAPQAPPVPDTPIVAVAPAAAPIVLQADADGVRIVQDGSRDGLGNVALDAITYDPAGEVQLSGRAAGNGAVQIYVDNQPVTTTAVTAGGDWQIELPQIDTGIYTLRIDEVDAEGAVISRLETPFKREERQEVAAVLAEETNADGFEVAVKTVQPGATLWAIAEENLGSGIFYVAIFEANSDLIRDPDLIYPGQIFRIPEIAQ
jgi:nucleoid-associated protein YgaU